MPSPENTPLPLPFPDASAPAFTTEEAQAAFVRYERPTPPRWRTALLHLLLFVVTLVTTTLAGLELTRGGINFLPIEIFLLPTDQLWTELSRGLWFSLPFLGVLTVHEFGHYFTARYNQIRVTLPYYIPFILGIGTFGAVIRIKDRIFSRREFFDVGLAGPLAGFLVAVPVLIYGFTHLPSLEYLFKIHPEYRPYGADYARYVYQGSQGMTLAKPLLYQGLEYLFADPALIPHPNELMHYPVLLAGVLALFFTALNLLPIGQLDGGHILYGLLGFQRFNRLSGGLFIAFIFYAGLGLFTLRTSSETWLYWGLPYLVYLFLVFRRALPTPRRAILLGLGVWAAQLAVTVAFPGIIGNPGWLVFGLMLGRLTGIYHPPAPDESPLSPGRKVLGWLMLAIFVLCFTPSPFR
ncbi:site-2 protease family protein [uncultured Hymenobacter sp.]|uniref:site-2 protease family protein n=1 Tax=uncultured Hymenobacter sp. TaxID=170016 RepID=UPI0035CA2EA8